MFLDFTLKWSLGFITGYTIVSAWLNILTRRHCQVFYYSIKVTFVEKRHWTTMLFKSRSMKYIAGLENVLEIIMSLAGVSIIENNWIRRSKFYFQRNLNDPWWAISVKKKFSTNLNDAFSSKMFCSTKASLLRVKQCYSITSIVATRTSAASIQTTYTVTIDWINSRICVPCKPLFSCSERTRKCILPRSVNGWNFILTSRNVQRKTELEFLLYVSFNSPFDNTQCWTQVQ